MWCNIGAMNQNRTSTFVLVGTVVVAVVMFISLLAGSGVQALRGFNPLNFIGSIFESRAAAGGLQVNLRPGEQSAVISVTEADATLSQHGVLGTSFQEFLPEVTSCILISSSEDQGMILCAPADAPAPGATAATDSFGLLVTPLTERADALMRNPEIGAVTVAKLDTSLTEHRKTLIEGGNSVLDFVTEYDLSDVTFAGLTLDRAEGSEWLGYADVGGVRHVAWAWAPSEPALNTLLKR